jgi:hypothetical protein
VGVLVTRSALRCFDQDELPVGAGERKRLASKLNAELEEYITEKLLPLFVEHLDAVPGGAHVDQAADSACELVIRYPSSVDLPSGPPYIAQQVRLEFGARNLIDPRTPNRIVPYVADLVLEEQPEFPIAAAVDVLALERIFWEKVTLAHDHCNREFADTRPADRISRHWYDLSVLADAGVAERARRRRDQLESVVRIKDLFYRRSTSDYAACLANGLRLVPDPEALQHLRVDYEEMTAAGMFLNQPRDFDSIIDSLRHLEALLNEHH